jgi:SAM-dependent methyltransferase
MADPTATAPALRETYDRAYYAGQVQGSLRSAAMLVPRILSLFPGTASVVDFGCGTGAWLHQFKVAGIGRVLGLDGGAPDDGMLLLSRGEFRGVDLAGPIRLEERFDLAMSLEVAEHLPPSAAPTFVASIAAAADAVVFGAALPGQGGTWHVNERWPSYWAALFDAEGFEAFDLLRRHAWHDRRLAWWYSQNTLVFARRSRADLIAHLRRVEAEGPPPQLDMVHPDCFEHFRRSEEWHRAAVAEGKAAREAAEAHHAEERARLEARLAAAEAAAAEAAQAAAATAARADAAETRAAAAEWKAAEAEAARLGMEASTSWRVTAPLRALTGRLRRR